MYYILRFLKTNRKRILLTIVLIATAFLARFHSKSELLKSLDVVHRWGPVVATVLFGTVLTLIGLLIAVLQISRQESLGALLYERTIKRSLDTLIKFFLLANFRMIAPRQNEALNTLFKDVEVMAESGRPRFGFTYQDMICLYDQRLFGVQCDEQVILEQHDSQSLLEGFGLPRAVRRAAKDLLVAKYNYLLAREPNAPFFNGSVVRLDDYRTLRDDLSGRHKLMLRLRRTNYYTFVCTNETLEEWHNLNLPLEPTSGIGRSIDDPTRQSDLASRRHEMMQLLLQHSPRQKVCFSKRSLLANSLIVNINLISVDNKLVYVRRSSTVARKPGFLSSAVSGNMDPSYKFTSPSLGADIDVDGCPNPFLSAIRQAWEELNVTVEKEAVVFFALCRVVTSNQPFLLGECRLSITFDEIIKMSKLARDMYERESLLFFDLDSSLEEMVRTISRDKKEWGKPSALGIMFSLMKRFGPRRVLETVRRCGIDHF